MRRNIFFPRNVHALSSALGIVTIISLWILFAPTQVGGLASYVIVIGSSMEPKFHIGDLVIAHQESRYQVGDAVVYRNTEMQGFVFHRIIAEDMRHFSLQGDNNSWLDTYQPTQEEVIGKLWLHIPRGGIAIQKVRSPWAMVLIAGIFGTVFITSFFANTGKGSKRMNKKNIREWIDAMKQNVRGWLTQINSLEPPKPSMFDPASMTEGSFFALGCVLLSSLIIGIISFSRPMDRAASNDIQFQHLGIYSYLASAPQGVYDSNTLKSGDPIFSRLTCVVDVNLQYMLIAQDATNLSGTHQLTAVIREQISGWQREVPLQEQTAFTGTSFGTTAKLDLCKIESLIQSMEDETDFHPGSYTLTMAPNITVTGKVSGRDLQGGFNSGLQFLYDRVHFYVAQDDDVDSSLSFTETGAIKVRENEANTVRFLNTQIPVLPLRWIAVTGLLASLAGLVFLGLKLQTLASTNQERFFRMKYGSLIVDAAHVRLPESGSCIEVTSMDALAKLAERFQTVILHRQNVDRHQYLVQSGGTTYEFEFSGHDGQLSVPENEAPGTGEQA